MSIKSPERKDTSSDTRLTSCAGSWALRPGQVVPGEAHLVVPAPRALDGHVEPVAYSQVVFLEEDLQSEQQQKKKTHLVQCFYYLCMKTNQQVIILWGIVTTKDRRCRVHMSKKLLQLLDQKICVVVFIFWKIFVIFDIYLT